MFDCYKCIHMCNANKLSAKGGMLSGCTNYKAKVTLEMSGEYGLHKKEYVDFPENFNPLYIKKCSGYKKIKVSLKDRVVLFEKYIFEKNSKLLKEKRKKK